jgi:hypothetical protein
MIRSYICTCHGQHRVFALTLAINKGRVLALTFCPRPQGVSHGMLNLYRELA